MPQNQPQEGKKPIDKPPEKPAEEAKLVPMEQFQKLTEEFRKLSGVQRRQTILRDPAWQSPAKKSLKEVIESSKKHLHNSVWFRNIWEDQRMNDMHQGFIDRAAQLENLPNAAPEEIATITNIHMSMGLIAFMQELTDSMVSVTEDYVRDCARIPDEHRNAALEQSTLRRLQGSVRIMPRFNLLQQIEYLYNAREQIRIQPGIEDAERKAFDVGLTKRLKELGEALGKEHGAAIRVPEMRGGGDITFAGLPADAPREQVRKQMHEIERYFYDMFISTEEVRLQRGPQRGGVKGVMDIAKGANAPLVIRAHPPHAMYYQALMSHGNALAAKIQETKQSPKELMETIEEDTRVGERLRQYIRQTLHLNRRFAVLAATRGGLFAEHEPLAPGEKRPPLSKEAKEGYKQVQIGDRAFEVQLQDQTEIVRLYTSTLMTEIMQFRGALPIVDVVAMFLDKYIGGLDSQIVLLSRQASDAATVLVGGPWLRGLAEEGVKKLTGVDVSRLATLRALAERLRKFRESLPDLRKKYEAQLKTIQEAALKGIDDLRKAAVGLHSDNADTRKKARVECERIAKILDARYEELGDMYESLDKQLTDGLDFHSLRGFLMEEEGTGSLLTELGVSGGILATAYGLGGAGGVLQGWRMTRGPGWVRGPVNVVARTMNAQTRPWMWLWRNRPTLLGGTTGGANPTAPSTGSGGVSPSTTPSTTPTVPKPAPGPNPAPGEPHGPGGANNLIDPKTAVKPGHPPRGAARPQARLNARVNGPRTYTRVPNTTPGRAPRSPGAGRLLGVGFVLAIGVIAEIDNQEAIANSKRCQDAMREDLRESLPDRNFEQVVSNGRTKYRHRISGGEFDVTSLIEGSAQLGRHTNLNANIARGEVLASVIAAAAVGFIPGLAIGVVLYFVADFVNEARAGGRRDEMRSLFAQTPVEILALVDARNLTGTSLGDLYRGFGNTFMGGGWWPRRAEERNAEMREAYYRFVVSFYMREIMQLLQQQGIPSSILFEPGHTLQSELWAEREHLVGRIRPDAIDRYGSGEARRDANAIIFAFAGLAVLDKRERLQKLEKAGSKGEVEILRSEILFLESRILCEETFPRAGFTTLGEVLTNPDRLKQMTEAHNRFRPGDGLERPSRLFLAAPSSNALPPPHEFANVVEQEGLVQLQLVGAHEELINGTLVNVVEGASGQPNAHFAFFSGHWFCRLANSVPPLWQRARGTVFNITTHGKAFHLACALYDYESSLDRHDNVAAWLILPPPRGLGFTRVQRDCARGWRTTGLAPDKMRIPPDIRTVYVGTVTQAVSLAPGAKPAFTLTDELIVTFKDGQWVYRAPNTPENTWLLVAGNHSPTGGINPKAMSSWLNEITGRQTSIAAEAKASDPQRRLFTETMSQMTNPAQLEGIGHVDDNLQHRLFANPEHAPTIVTVGLGSVWTNDQYVASIQDICAQIIPSSSSGEEPIDVIFLRSSSMNITGQDYEVISAVGARRRRTEPNEYTYTNRVIGVRRIGSPGSFVICTGGSGREVLQKADNAAVQQAMKERNAKLHEQTQKKIAAEIGPDGQLFCAISSNEPVAIGGEGAGGLTTYRIPMGDDLVLARVDGSGRVVDACIVPNGARRTPALGYQGLVNKFAAELLEEYCKANPAYAKAFLSPRPIDINRVPLIERENVEKLLKGFREAVAERAEKHWYEFENPQNGPSAGRLFPLTEGQRKQAEALAKAVQDMRATNNKMFGQDFAPLNEDQRKALQGVMLRPPTTPMPEFIANLLRRNLQSGDSRGGSVLSRIRTDSLDMRPEDILKQIYDGIMRRTNELPADSVQLQIQLTSGVRAMLGGSLHSEIHLYDVDSIVNGVIQSVPRTGMPQ